MKYIDLRRSLNYFFRLLAIYRYKTIIFVIITAALSVYLICKVLNYISYNLFKNRVLRTRKWGLNICCGMTDGGGVNIDIVAHKELPKFVLIDNIYNLPFKDKQFESVLCSHTMEHIEDIKRFYNELCRVGENVTILVPPLWDISAAFNLLEHKWLFFTFHTKSDGLPRHIRLPGARVLQKVLGQKIKA